MEPLRIAVIGCGGRSRASHLPIFSEGRDVKLVALCDPVQAGRDRAGTAFGVERRYAAVEELLHREKPDAVVIAVPPEFNASAAMPCLERGIPTLMEKPPAM